jgi:hypothetical protein
MQVQRTPHRRTASEILNDYAASIPSARPRPAYCCPRCGVVGHDVEEHDQPARVRIPLVARLMA